LPEEIKVKQEKTNKQTNKQRLNQDSLSLSRDVKSELPEYKAEVLTT
jgi:hypothetical protein